MPTLHGFAFSGETVGAGQPRAEVVALRALAVGVASLLVVAAALEARQLPLVAALVVALTLHLQSPAPRWRRAGGVLLLLASGAAVGATDGVQGPLLGVLLLLIADAAQRERTEWVLAVSGAAVAVTVASALVLGSGPASLEPAWLWALVLVPVTGVAAGRGLPRRSGDGAQALESATVALDEVLVLAERMPAGFDRWSVAMAVHEEVREVARAAGADPSTLPLLLVVVDDLLLGVGNPIARRPVGLVSDLPLSRHRRWTSLATSDLPELVRTTVAGDRAVIHRLESGELHGVVIAPDDLARPARDAVVEVTGPAAVALANVDRFERLEALALSAARVRLAHDLHDGVAQALTHVRFELDLLALGHPDVTAELARIRSVADAALLDVRRTVDELRETVPLAARLERHVALLRSFAEVDLDLTVDVRRPLPTDVGDDLFRIAQEALSNALRHSGATTVRVSLHVDDDGISLVVVDDGGGLLGDLRSRRGIGLDAMQSRARRLGGSVVHRDRRGGGTVVALSAPRPPGRPSSGPRRPARLRVRSGG